MAALDRKNFTDPVTYAGHRSASTIAEDLARLHLARAVELHKIADRMRTYAMGRTGDPVETEITRLLEREEREERDLRAIC